MCNRFSAAWGLSRSAGQKLSPTCPSTRSVKTQQHSGNAHLSLTLSQRRFANSLVKLGQVHALSPSNSNKLTESSRPQNVKTPTQNLEPNSNCTTASGQPKESCLRHNFSTERLGRATIGPSGAKLNGVEGETKSGMRQGLSGTCKRGCQGRSTLTKPNSPRSSSLRREKGENLTLSCAHLLELAAYSLRLAYHGTWRTPTAKGTWSHFVIAPDCTSR